MDSKDKLVTLEDLKAVHDEVARYTTCSTGASTVAKTATLTNFVLTTGSAVKVKFTNTNTAANPTLNVNSTGAKPIMQYGTTVAGTTATESWDDGAVVEFVYDGTNWVMQGRNTIDAVSKANGGVFTGNIAVNRANTTTESTQSLLSVGNSTPSGTAGASYGLLQLFGDNDKYIALKPVSGNLSGNRTVNLPDLDGTVMLNVGGIFTGNIAVIKENNNTSSTQSLITAGNNIPEGTAGASYGGLQLYGANDKYIFLRAPTTALGANRTVFIPDESGTIALQNPVITGTSFANMTTVPQYPRNVMETIRTDIASYSNGIYNVASSGGPQYFAHIGKYNNNYWAAMLQTYTDTNIYFVQYANGECKVRIVSQ